MSLAALIATGTKVWLDGIGQADLAKNRRWGVTGATSNPTLVSGVITAGHYDDQIVKLARDGLGDSQIAWELNNQLIIGAQELFLPSWEQTQGDDGYVASSLIH